MTIYHWLNDRGEVKSSSYRDYVPKNTPYLNEAVDERRDENTPLYFVHSFTSYNFSTRYFVAKTRNEQSEKRMTKIKGMLEELIFNIATDMYPYMNEVQIIEWCEFHYSGKGIVAIQNAIQRKAD